MFTSTCLYVNMLTCIRLHMFTCLLRYICSHDYMPSYVPKLSSQPKGGVGGIHGIMFTHPHILTPTCTRTHICTCHLPTYVQYICSHVHVYISTYVFTCSLVIQTRVHLITAHLSLCPVFIRSVCIHMFHSTRTHMFMCPPVHVSVCTHVFIYSYAHMYITTHMLTCSPAHMYHCSRTHMFMRPSVHMSVCTHVHILICSRVHDTYMLTCTLYPYVHVFTCTYVSMYTCSYTHMLTCT